MGTTKRNFEALRYHMGEYDGMAPNARAYVYPAENLTPQPQVSIKIEATPYEMRGEVESIAKLIAAAPDLLAALEGMMEWARRVKQSNPGPEVSNAVAAIAKATK